MRSVGGQAATIVPVPPNDELTLAKAAELLHVPRSFLVQHLLGKVIPFEAASHRRRRVRLEYVLAYRERLARERRSLLDDMTAAAQNVDGGYR